ncbi:WD40 repeat domain-containing protein [Rhodopseudomonas pseudopalustris]|uniref:WD40 repeat domain-containing protein n=1 Tax=Rhodopseudomonas pseudopalustris TaxID=1513892 RepID=UPI003F979F94
MTSDIQSGDAEASIPSVTARVHKFALGAPAASAFFLGDTLAVVGTEEAVTLIRGLDQTERIEVAFGAILCAASDGKRVVTGGDDGKVTAIDASGTATTIATDAKRRWIDNVALHPDGAVAWSAGKTAYVRGPKGEEKTFDVPSTVGGLAFAPKGLRLAIAHYNGVTLWFPNMAAKPDVLEWAGSHLGVMFSADNRFLITAMHEPALHGWRLSDGQHMRMTGYPGRVRSMAWTVGGKGLATSGADAVIIWPFATKDGPMGKQPAMLAPLQARVTAVACDANAEVLACGYSNGVVMMVRIGDGAEILVRGEGSPVTAVAWAADGETLAYACEDGEVGVLPL